MFNIFLRQPKSPDSAGPLLRLLRRLGPSWQASPLMRLIQASALVCFLVLFLWVSWPFRGDTRINPQLIPDKEFLPTESFLILDPLVSISGAIASRTWVWSLWGAVGIFVFSLLVPRGFCAYICPLGATIDLFDWAVGKRIRASRTDKAATPHWWFGLRYYILTVILIASIGGVSITGFAAAIPVLTRAMTFIVNPLQIGLLRGWGHVPSIHAGQIVSIGLFAVVLLLGLIRPRFWCRYLCPTGAVFSVFSYFRVSERTVQPTCVRCGKSLEICPFDAIRPDLTTRSHNCAFCQVCAGTCPAGAITFSHRWKFREAPPAPGTPTSKKELSRRGFLFASAIGCAGVVGLRGTSIPGITKVGNAIRPPGAVPEPEFLNLCIRCGACLRVCPDSVLQAAPIADQGVKGMWTPRAVFSWAGCDENCNFCGQACPTGAIRALPIDEKRCAAVGVAVVRKDLCLPHAGIGSCDICFKECQSTGYKAISYVRVHARHANDAGAMGDEGLLAPEVDPVKCVGCGRCQNRCYLTYVKDSSQRENSPPGGKKPPGGVIQMNVPAIHVQTSPVKVKSGGSELELGGEMRLRPPESYKDEMARRAEKQKSTKRIIDVEW